MGLVNKLILSENWPEAEPGYYDDASMAKNLIIDDIHSLWLHQR